MIISNKYPLDVKGKKLFIANSCTIEIWTENSRLRLFSLLTFLPLWYGVLSSFSLTRRVFRAGIHHFVSHDRGYIIFIHKMILIFDCDCKFQHRYNLKSGKRPLNILVVDNKIFYGDYFANTKRESVSIYALDMTNLNHTTIFTFQSGLVRHIHNIHYWSGKYFILTGDEDNESGIWISNDDFKSCTLLCGGSQKFRAVSILYENDRLIIPSDTPLERNFIRSYNIKSGHLEDVHEIEGSSFHNLKINDFSLVTTVVEPSAINKSNQVCMYASKDGVNWSRIIGLNKDLFPRWLFRFTRYPEIKIFEDLWNGHIIIHGRAIKGCSDGLILFPFKRLNSRP